MGNKHLNKEISEFEDIYEFMSPKVGGDYIVDIIMDYKKQFEYAEHINKLFEGFKFNCMFGYDLNHNSLNEKYMSQIFTMYKENMFKYYKEAIIKLIEDGEVRGLEINSVKMVHKSQYSGIHHSSVMVIIDLKSNACIHINGFMRFYEFEIQYGY